MKGKDGGWKLELGWNYGLGKVEMAKMAAGCGECVKMAAGYGN